MKHRIILCIIASLASSCATDPLWEREGGILNPWGGEFLELRKTRRAHITPCATNTCNNQDGAKCLCSKSPANACFCPVFK